MPTGIMCGRIVLNRADFKKRASFFSAQFKILLQKFPAFFSRSLGTLKSVQFKLDNELREDVINISSLLVFLVENCVSMSFLD